MKKILAIYLAAGMAATMAFAQESGSEGVTQAQLAEVLVRALGLVDTLPNPASDQQRFAALMQNGICPDGGWTAGQVLTKKDLVKILVQALGAEDEVENPEDPASWMAVLEAHGIDPSSLGDQATVMGLEALPEAIAVNYGELSTDPLLYERNPAGASGSYTVETIQTRDSSPSVAGTVVSLPVVQKIIDTGKVSRKPSKPTPTDSAGHTFFISNPYGANHEENLFGDGGGGGDCIDGDGGQPGVPLGERAEIRV